MAGDTFEIGGFVGEYNPAEDVYVIRHSALTGPITIDKEDAFNLEVLLKALQLRSDAGDSLQAERELETLEERHNL